MERKVEKTYKERESEKKEILRRGEKRYKMRESRRKEREGGREKKDIKMI